MYPSGFDYAAPTSLDEALSLLPEHGAYAAVLAGGQSLIPMMKLRLAAPAFLVDINGVPGLDFIERANGHLRVGALAPPNWCRGSLAPSLRCDANQSFGVGLQAGFRARSCDFES